MNQTEERAIRAKNGGYLHGEAYCLMTYKCRTCGTPETLWNSRDGVTPFIISCRVCGGESQHVNWRSDRRTPDYQPQPGTRIFADTTHARAYDQALRVYDRMMASKYRRDDMAKEEFVRMVLGDMQLGDPDVVEVQP